MRKTQTEYPFNYLEKVLKTIQIWTEETSGISFTLFLAVSIFSTRVTRKYRQRFSPLFFSFTRNSVRRQADQKNGRSLQNNHPIYLKFEFKLTAQK